MPTGQQKGPQSATSSLSRLIAPHPAADRQSDIGTDSQSASTTSPDSCHRTHSQLRSALKSRSRPTTSFEHHFTLNPRPHVTMNSQFHPTTNFEHHSPINPQSHAATDSQLHSKSLPIAISQPRLPVDSYLMSHPMLDSQSSLLSNPSFRLAMGLKPRPVVDPHVSPMVQLQSRSQSHPATNVEVHFGVNREPRLPVSPQPRSAVGSQPLPAANSRSRPVSNSQLLSASSPGSGFLGLATSSRSITSSRLRSPMSQSQPTLGPRPANGGLGAHLNGAHYLTTTPPVIRDISDDRDHPPIRNGIPSAEFTGPINGAFYNAHNVVLNHPVFVEGAHPKEKDCINLLAKSTIPGAQFDSGERYPPPVCHPGTRLDISEKLVSWIRDLEREYKVVWLHGPAGVGKSAIVQTLAESEANSRASVLGATIFFSTPNKRNNSQRVFVTIAYQLAVKYPAYRAYVVELLVVDPLLVGKSMVEQFKWLIVKPFGKRRLLEELHKTVLITLDGLDECDGESSQREIIFLISGFCLEYSTAPLIWVITSRPEPHICTVFAHRSVQGTYMEINMPVDADQACRDVEHYLRDKFAEIKEKYPRSFSPTQRWPTEAAFIKISKHSSGLFAFANTVVRFTSDAQCANPVAQLQEVLSVLERPSSSAGGESPFAALDVIYTLIMSSVSLKALSAAQKLLRVMGKGTFLDYCNFFAITQAGAYSALQKLHSVLDIPEPDDAGRKRISVFHKSFSDYLNSPSRSGSFWLDPQDTEKVRLSASVRILLEAHDSTQLTVHLSSINLSWLRGGRGPDKQRKKYLRWSLNLVTDVPHSLAKELNSLCGFFQDIDWANFGNYLDIKYYVEEVMLIEKVVTTLLLTPFSKEWEIIKIVEIQSLHYKDLDWNKPVYDWEPELRAAADDNGDVITTVLFPPYSRQSKTDLWFDEDDDRPWGRTQILRSIADLPPSHPAIVLGKGSKSLVFIGTGCWIYAFCYK